MRKPNSWIKSNGKFQIRSIRQAEDYIKHVSGLKEVSIMRTRKFLFITYIGGIKIYNYHNIYMKSGLYSLTELDFKPLFEEMGISLPAHCPQALEKSP
jgi:hypothetical protein